RQGRLAHVPRRDRPRLPDAPAPRLRDGDRRPPRAARPFRFDGRDRPLRARDNPVELFQIWLNLPPRDKMAQPYFAMLWADTIPKTIVRDGDGRTTEL